MVIYTFYNTISNADLMRKLYNIYKYVNIYNELHFYKR